MPQLTPPSDPTSLHTLRACQPCARAKVRCEIEVGDETCKRCRRLNKACGGQIPGAHRRKNAKKFDVARLEKKLDSVAAILATSRQTPTVVDALLPSTPADVTPTAWIDKFVKSDTEAEMIVQTFRDEMAQFFPFIVIPPGMMFKELREKKPFLLFAILMVGCRHDPDRQSAIAMKFREVVSYNILIKGDKSLDILQSLLVYINWYNFYLHLHVTTQLSNLVHLAMAMMTDLGLHRGVLQRSLKPSLGYWNYFARDSTVAFDASTSYKAPSNLSTTRSIEERRAFLGCFFLATIFSNCVRDIYPIRYSEYVDECCRAISEASEYPTDIYVVYLTHLYSLVNKITHTLAPSEWHMTAAFTSAPIGACVKSLESDLLTLRTSLPDGDYQNILLMHYYTAEILLYETSLNDEIDPMRFGTYPLARLNMLYACLNSVKLFYDAVYTLPVLQWFDIPYSVWSLVGHAMVILSRLSLFRAEGWDQGYVRTVLDFSRMMDELARRFDEAKVLVESSSQTNNDLLPRAIPLPFSQVSAKFQFAKAAHESKYAAQTGRSDHVPDQSSEDASVIPTDDDFAFPCTTPFFDFLEDNFWQQFT